MIDFVDMLTLSSVSPLDILREVNPAAVPADSPPDAANYRTADLQGVACAHCSKFVLTGFDGEGEESVPKGYCSQWEALVQGDHVSDGFADPGPALDENGDEMWDFADQRGLSEIHLTGTDTQEKDGFVVKEILRVGEWPVMPTRGGVQKKPLKVVASGVSNRDEGIVSLAELEANFKSGAIERVQIPLSDDNDDHKNITRLNTGYVRDLWIDGDKLLAKMEFTEPEVREKVLRGTYADVSCGIPWSVTSRGKKFGSCVEHVAITNRPFIDGLGPFLAASDKDKEIKDDEIVHFSQASSEPEPQDHSLTAMQILRQSTAALTAQLALDSHYHVDDLAGTNIIVSHDFTKMSWSAPFQVKDGAVVLSEPRAWTMQDEGKREAPAEQKPAAPRQPSSPEGDDLEAAQRIREIRLSNSPNPTKKEAHMGLTREELDRLDLSDEQRAAFQQILDENARNAAQAREAEADRRVTELEDLGLKERPGALTFYRQVYLQDDGGPALVLSENGQEKARLTAREILDRFIEAIKGSDGKLALSDQHLASGNDEPPPADTSDEKPLDERLAAAKEAIYGRQ